MRQAVKVVLLWSCMLATPSAHANGDGGYIKIDQAYYCAVSDGSEVERILTKDGRYVERWRRDSSSNPGRITIGRWKVQLRGDVNQLSISDVMNWDLSRDAWEPSGASQYIETVSEGKMQGVDLDFTDAQRKTLQCRFSKERTTVMLGWINDLWSRASSARYALENEAERTRYRGMGLSMKQAAAMEIAQLKKKSDHYEAAGVSLQCNSRYVLLRQRLIDAMQMYTNATRMRDDEGVFEAAARIARNAKTLQQSASCP